MGTLAYLPSTQLVTVCLPDAAKSINDVLTVQLNDHLLSALEVGPGDWAIVSLTEPPAQGEPGAIRHNGIIYVGFIFYMASDGLILSGAEWMRMAAYFEPGTFEILGRVDRVCRSCERNACRRVPRVSETPKHMLRAG